mgnify:CR=1 FL=1
MQQRFVASAAANCDLRYSLLKQDVHSGMQGSVLAQEALASAAVALESPIMWPSFG